LKQSLKCIHPFLHSNPSILIACFQLSNPPKIIFLDIKITEGAFIPPFAPPSYAYAYKDTSHHEHGGKNLLWSHFPTVTSTVVIFAELHDVAVRNEVSVSFRNFKSPRLRTFYKLRSRECSKTCSCWCCGCTVSHIHCFISIST
jgi:hypothetical protein